MSRPIWQRFESVLADPITRYLAAKRSMGCRFNTEDRHCASSIGISSIKACSASAT